MTLLDIEKQYGFEFPAKFHEIRNTGSMEWLECGYDFFHSHSEKFINDPHAFMMINADCEPISTDVYANYMAGLEELKRDGEEYEKVTLNPKYRFIPFAFTGGGDYYCFVYEGEREPFVIRLYHDEFDYQFYGKDFDEFLYVTMLDAAYSMLWEGQDYRSETWIAHLDYLSEQYKELLEKSAFVDEGAVEKVLNQIVNCVRPEIWVPIGQN